MRIIENVKTYCELVGGLSIIFGIFVLLYPPVQLVQKRSLAVVKLNKILEILPISTQTELMELINPPSKTLWKNGEFTIFYFLEECNKKIKNPYHNKKEPSYTYSDDDIWNSQIYAQKKVLGYDDEMMRNLESLKKPLFEITPHGGMQRTDLNKVIKDFDNLFYEPGLLKAFLSSKYSLIKSTYSFGFKLGIPELLIPDSKREGDNKEYQVSQSCIFDPFHIVFENITDKKEQLKAYKALTGPRIVYSFFALKYRWIYPLYDVEGVRIFVDLNNHNRNYNCEIIEDTFPMDGLTIEKRIGNLTQIYIPFFRAKSDLNKIIIIKGEGPISLSNIRLRIDLINYIEPFIWWIILLPILFILIDRKLINKNNKIRKL